MSGTQGFPRGTNILVALGAATLTAIGISGIRGILAPVLLTLILTICANPVRTGLLKRGVPGGLATGSVIVVVFGLLAGFTYTLILATAQFVAMLPNYSKQFEQIGANIGAWLTSIGVGPDQVQTIEKGLTPTNIGNLVSNVLGSVASITGALVIILTMMILMAADAAYAHTILHQLGTRNANLVSAFTDYASNVRRYMVVTTLLGVVQGTLNAIALYILHVPAALLWGLLAFLYSCSASSSAAGRP
jgi:AI-2 transport protein TqsA